LGEEKKQKQTTTVEEIIGFRTINHRLPMSYRGGAE